MKKYILFFTTLFFISSGNTQVSNSMKPNELIYRFKNDSIRYVKATVLGQFWSRYNHNNPGSTVFGTPQDHVLDVGIRRARFSVMSQFTRNTFFYAQFGLNNLNSISARKSGLFLHDFSVEQRLYKDFIVVGGGLSGWSGTSRFASSAIGSILTADLPVIQETTNDVTDQFGRKFGLFVKGNVHRISYRLSVAKPFPVQSALSAVEQLPPTVQNVSYFSTKAPKLNVSSYVFWQFLERETANLPYMAGSYLGSKKILNLGLGFQYQEAAFWYRNLGLDTISVPLKQFGVDLMYDSYLNFAKRNAITFYAAGMLYDFGPNYIRNIGVFNLANGVNSKGSFNGAGNAMPLLGTGKVLYAQAAYLFKKDLLGKVGTLQPYSSLTFANYKGLKDNLKVYNIGINWLFAGNNSKLSLDYQSRPVYYKSGANIVESKSARRGQILLQYQISI